MRRSITRSSLAFRQSANKLSSSSYIYSSSALYSSSSRSGSSSSSSSSPSSSSSSSGQQSRKHLDSEFSNVVRQLTDQVKSSLGTSNPSFTELIQTITSNPELVSRISQLSQQTEKIFPNATGSGSRSGQSSSNKPVRVAVTGAAGAIGYALLFRLASGQLLGENVPIQLQCLEIPQGLKAMEGVKMELNDCAFPLLRGVEVTDSAEKAFDGAEYVFFVGAQPRTKGMDRAELLKKNAGIFSAQGKALNKSADRSKVKVLVVGNPANTNCLIAANNAPDINPRQFSAMTRLDHNRGLAQLAEKLGVNVGEIQKFAIWGNHSDTQFPDITNTTIRNGESVKKLIDPKWNSDTFIPTVAKRGAAIIAARGSSSAASAANAAIDQMRDWALGSNGEWTSMAVWTGGEGGKATPYGVSSEIYYSYPVICEGGDYRIVENLPVDADAAKRMQATNDELVKERSDAGELAVRQKK